MKLHPIRITGIAGVVVFGGILVFTLMKGPRDPDLLPSGVRISDLPAISAPAIDTTPLPSDPLAIGSQDAKDDLYCSGVVIAKQIQTTGAALDERESNAYADLAEAGRAKLSAEGATRGAGAYAASNAWSDKARTEFKAGTPAISFDACMSRAAALPGRLALGSQDARDDLYCSGVIFAVHRSRP